MEMNDFKGVLPNSKRKQRFFLALAAFFVANETIQTDTQNIKFKVDDAVNMDCSARNFVLIPFKVYRKNLPSSFRKVKTYNKLFNFVNIVLQNNAVSRFAKTDMLKPYLTKDAVFSAPNIEDDVDTNIFPKRNNQGHFVSIKEVKDFMVEHIINEYVGGQDRMRVLDMLRDDDWIKKITDYAERHNLLDVIKREFILYGFKY